MIAVLYGSTRPAAEGCPGSQEECTLQVSRRLIALGAASAILIAACSGSGATASSGRRLQGLRRVRHRRPRRQGLQRPRQEGPGRRQGTRASRPRRPRRRARPTTRRNIQRLLDEGCKTIITVGFLQGSATAKATLANPTIAFGQVDTTWNSAGADFTPGTADDPPPGVPANFTGLDYQVDQAAMLAGYLAASFSKSGKVGDLRRPGLPGRDPVHGRLLRRRPVLQRAEGHERRGPRLGRLPAGSDDDRHLRRRQRWHRHLERPGQGRAVRQDLPRPGRRHRPPGRGRDGQRHDQGDARGRQVGHRRRHRPGAHHRRSPRLRSSRRPRRPSTSPSSTSSRRTSGGDLGGEDYSGTLANNGVLLSPVPRLRQPDLGRD